jgi:toxin ParE1/3/4
VGQAWPMRLRYTLPALADLTHILDYIALRSPSGAARIQSRIQNITSLLVQCPHAGRTTDVPNIRPITTPPYPYLIFYEIAGDEIVIHAVRHGARDPSSNPGSSEPA